MKEHNKKHVASTLRFSAPIPTGEIYSRIFFGRKQPVHCADELRSLFISPRKNLHPIIVGAVCVVLNPVDTHTCAKSPGMVFDAKTVGSFRRLIRTQFVLAHTLARAHTHTLVGVSGMNDARFNGTLSAQTHVRPVKLLIPPRPTYSAFQLSIAGDFSA